jgi:hypothetical protein
MQRKKIFILLPDGVGLRNFAYTRFCETGREKGFDVVFWNMTPFDLAALGLDEIRLDGAKTHPLTEIYKRVRQFVEFNLNIRRSGDRIYEAYRFKAPVRGVKSGLKKALTGLLIATHSTDHGLARIRKRIETLERKTGFYDKCKAVLQKEAPDFVFCTNQRHTLTVAPMLAARDLGIPNATFIFSWDNLPKGTMVVEPDWYFVWSDLMRSQLQYYYPFIKSSQVIIAGTPQFEPHYDAAWRMTRAEFCAAHGLDSQKKYICFSGDDVTSSPDDPDYLEDTARAVRQLNQSGHALGIVFRRCPVDFSGRYDDVLDRYGDVIVAVDPKWTSLSSVWSAILPQQQDNALLVNTALHCEMVVNLGSSMVFDFAAFGKPCGYFNYNQPRRRNPQWDIHRCYRFIHFRSMPDRSAVFWIDGSDSIESHILQMLENPLAVVSAAKRWFETVVRHPPFEASKRIWDGISKIIDHER